MQSRGYRAAKGEWLFPAKRDPTQHTHKPNNAHTAALKRSGIVPGFRLHDLRHTALTRMGEGGVDLVTLASIAGHSKIEMTKRYSHPSEQHQESALEKAHAHNEAERAKAAESALLNQNRPQRPN